MVKRIRTAAACLLAFIGAGSFVSGAVNSVTAPQHDLSLEQVSVRATQGRTRLEFMIMNRGLGSEAYSALFLVNPSTSDTLAFVALGEIAPGDSTIVWGEFDFDGMYFDLRASLSDDEQPDNNVLDFIASGREYPPFILTEILANPTEGLTAEWTEIRNRLNHDWDIDGWSLGVGNDLKSIEGAGQPLSSGERIILTDDSTGFRDYYSSGEIIILQLQSWAVLRNSGDTIRLIDQFGIEADRFEYTATFDSNYTWSRGEDFLHVFDWGRSDRLGGSPGEENIVLFAPPGAGNISVTVQPTHITPDGDGINDAAEISITTPPADGFTMKLFDSNGRLVRIFLEEVQFIPDPVLWDGTSQAGNRLPIGIYILYFEAIGVGTSKTTVVIAR